jgi:hypothetical protein
MSLEEQIKTVEGVIEQETFCYNNARSPRNKKTHKNAVDFWISILNSLTELKLIKA